jgi:transcriptional regulator with XRE-family HTH domain
MAYKIDFSIATSNQIEKALCQQLEDIRLAQNITQNQLALTAGLSVQTIKRMAQGKGVTVDTFIRVLIALGIQENLASLLPAFHVRPIERIKMKGTERKRARPTISTAEPHPWVWHEETGEDE